MKYTVTHTDGSPVDPGAVYYVLRIDDAKHSPWRKAARLAVAAFAGLIHLDYPEQASAAIGLLEDNP